MTFFKRINTITNIRPFINNCSIRYSHHDSQHYYLSQKNRDIRSLLGEEAPQKIIINLLGKQKSVDTASWEIKSFAQEKQLPSANIVYDSEMLRIMLCRNNFLQFIVNRCYNMSCQNLLYLNNDIININETWKPYNLYVLPNATNRFNTCDFIRNCEYAKFIIYPLAAPEENKRRDISFLIDN
jgi:hypothetical protein